MNTRHLWLTGFGPFPGVQDNPSGHIVRALTGAQIGPFTVATDILPVRFSGTRQRLAQGHKRLRPRLVVHLGVASRRRLISLERRARNSIGASRRDQDGRRSGRARIDLTQESRVSLSTGLSLVPVTATLTQAGFGARVSHDAGDYLCNLSYWHGLELASRCPWPLDVLFVHVPAIGTRCAGGDGAWTKEGLTAAIVCCLRALAPQCEG